VRDNGCWHARDAAHKPPPAALASLQEGAARLNARLRLWHWPGAGAELELWVPALQAYAPNARAS
jgi:nitrate/nitrite-specific signal transduction histidine kinase